MRYLDTETCGFHGPIVLIQWAIDDGNIHIHDVWYETVQSTMQLIEHIVNDDVCMFNASFDWFHLCQMYTTMAYGIRVGLLKADEPPDIVSYAIAEPYGRDGQCLKPKGVIDLMLHARKGPYQSMMDRDDIRIKKVPTVLAWDIADELTTRIPIRDIYFAKRQNKKQRWSVEDIYDDFGDIIPDFKDIILRFAPSSALKALAVDALGYDDVLVMADVGVSSNYKPVEYGYAPFALSGYFEKTSHDASGTKHKDIEIYNRDSNGKIIGLKEVIDWGGKWPTVIRFHIEHWRFSAQARQYASDDIKYTRELHAFLSNHPDYDPPQINDDDSVLACMVGAVRWKGFSVDLDGIQKQRDESAKSLTDYRKLFNPNAPEICKKYLSAVMSSDEQMCLSSTKKNILEEIAGWKVTSVCDCGGFGIIDPSGTDDGHPVECPVCHNSGLVVADDSEPHPAALRASEILDARRAKKRIEIFDKITMAGRFHASLEVIGALSGRMSGAGSGLNAQGINREKTVRRIFTLGWPGLDLDGGDFESFEVSIVDGAYNDPVLHGELKSGKKIHALLGEFFFPDMTYDDIVASSGLPGDQDKYIRSKNGVFAIIYFGEGYTLHNRVGIPERIAEEAFQGIIGKYRVFAQERKRYLDMFASMRQPRGIGTRVEWHEPHDYVETMLGFRRYYTLENRICKALYDLASDPPEKWKQMKLKVIRRDREQTACGSVRSALFAAAFAVQGANMRSAGNHVIQGTGSQLTKRLQARLWTLQPTGINDWEIMLLNIHDEIMAPNRRHQEAECLVKSFVEEYRELIPLLGIDWKTGIKNWGEK